MLLILCKNQKTSSNYNIVHYCQNVLKIFYENKVFTTLNTDVNQFFSSCAHHYFYLYLYLP